MIRTTLAILLILAPAPAFAWGKTGHRVTGAIAARHIGKSTARRIRAILGPETLAEASTWPDFMRASPDPFWRAAGAWHSVLAPDGAHAGAPEQGDAVTALAAFSATVRDPRAPLAERQRALRFIVHIVGDLHQPLHACAADDHCGGDVAVRFFGQPTNLHMLWDEGLIDRQFLSYSEWTDWLDARITPQQARDWRRPDPRTWIAESAALRPSIYPAGTELGKDYDFRFKAVVEQRLAMAGIRIAAYLDALFAKPVSAGAGASTSPRDRHSRPE